MKNKEGSIVLGIIILLSVLLTLSCFVYESFTVYLMKERLSDSVDRATAASSLEVTFDITDGKYFNFAIDEVSAKSAFNKTLKVVNLNSAYSLETIETLYVVNDAPQTILVAGKEILIEYPSVVGFKEVKTNNGFLFFKNKAIQAASIVKIDLRSCLEEGLTLEERTNIGCKIR